MTVATMSGVILNQNESSPLAELWVLRDNAYQGSGTPVLKNFP